MGVRLTALWTTALLAAALWLAATATVFAAPPAADAREFDGVRLQLDNDLFAAGGARDRDYTGGFAITISGENARDGMLSLDPLLKRIDAIAVPEGSSSVYHARQFGLMAFTPADIESTLPVYDDRPYASLLFMSNGRVSVDADGRGAWSSSLTIGVLGLKAAGELHSDIHELVGSDPVHGYDNQISAGGEPTARYTLARHHLWIANPSATLDVKTTLQGSVGYLTETSAAISMRVGRFNSPWWSFAPELTDYIAAPVPVAARSGGTSELYFFTGARLKARVYSAFLQGQFRDSAVEYSHAEIEPLVAEVWVGVVTQIFENTQLSYTLNYQTAELRDGEADRSALWGGVQLSHSF
ncbi:lipid A deacylase LpxR family protein [Povalibacter sp.]|uniref:lipid A deacylase LpxR family protein n=1 Tax=Povalibacter sp. TaxID=1962978 RepID=UPI002F4156BD